MEALLRRSCPKCTESSIKTYIVNVRALAKEAGLKAPPTNDKWLTKKLLRVGPNLLSFEVYLYLTKSDEFQCNLRTSIPSQLNKGISKFKFQKYYQPSWNVSRRNFDVVHRVHFGVISLHGGSTEIHCPNFQSRNPLNVGYQVQNGQKQTIF